MVSEASDVVKSTKVVTDVHQRHKERDRQNIYVVKIYFFLGIAKYFQTYKKALHTIDCLNVLNLSMSSRSSHNYIIRIGNETKLI